MSDSAHDKELQRALEEVAAPAVHTLKAQRGRHALVAAVSRVLPVVVIIPGLYFVFCLALRGAGVDFRPSLWWVIGAAIGYPLALLIAYWRRGTSKNVGERSALAAIDDTLQLKDRLSTAHEFLADENRSPFMQAAIDDAEDKVEEAKRIHLEASTPPLKLQRSQALWPAAAVLLIVIGAIINVRPPLFEDRKTEGLQAATDGEGENQVNRAARKKDPRKNDTKKETPSDERKSGNRKDGGSDEVPADKKQSKGKVGLGKSAQAQSAGGQSSGEGAASAQAQPTKGGSKKKPKKQAKKPKESSKKKHKPQEAPKDDKESIASAGRGRGKGASRSPTASDWASKDQIVTDEDEEFDEDEDVDDDEEESDARGGVQPNLRQRKPPVNRDLNIGFGGGKPPPFANGRGGPGLPKKQRGVAQLVLGVPYPDQITGQPNPGMTKVTQERIEPQSTQSKQIDADARTPRNTPMGRLKQRVLKPWMQDLVREFYNSLTTQNAKE